MNTIIEGIKQMLKPIQLTRTIILTAMLLLGGMTAKARDYVITYTTGGTTYYLGMNGNSLASKTTFDPTCVWTCYNGNNEANLGNNSYSLRNKNNSSAYLTTSCDRSGSIWSGYTYTWTDLTIQSNASNLWRSSNGVDGNVYAYYSSGGIGSWNRSASIHVNTLTMQDNDTDDSQNYQVTTSQQDPVSTNPTITGADLLTTTGNSTYTASGAAFQIGYTNYRFNSTDHYIDENGNSFTGTPSPATIGTYTWNLTSNDYATLSTNTGSPCTLNVTSLPQSDVTLTLTVTVPATGGNPAAPANTTLTGTKEITIQGTKPSAPIITVSGTTVTMSTNAIGTTSIRYTLDGTEPTASYGTVYSGPIDLSSSTTSPVTVKAVTVRNGNASDVSTEVVTLTLPEPVITADGSAGTATITCDISGATIYYTLDGSEPTTSSNQYTESLSDLSLMTTIKAIAVKSGWNDSPVASETLTIPSGVSGGTVTLFDLEDHSWSYYSDPECPIRSLNPADVKITYHGNGKNTISTTNGPTPANDSWTQNATTVKVSNSEADSVFVYYKTLERTDGSSSDNPSGRCEYTAIPNPFSVRPTYGSGDTRWRGFYKWRVRKLSGGSIYDAASGGNSIGVGGTIDGDQKIYFAPSASTGMEVELEALWARAYVVTSNTTTGLNSDVSYERNFVYLSSNTTLRNAALGSPVTYTTLDPATGTGTKRTITIRDNFTCAADTKFENLTFAQYNNGSQTITANNHDLIVGRGCSGTIGLVRGMNSGSSSAVDYTIRLESGTFNQFELIDNTARTFSSTVSTRAIFGSDYDRAGNNGEGDNTKLSIAANSTVYGGNAVHVFSSASNKNNLTYDWLIKSGKVQGSKTVTDANADESIYIGNSGNNDNTQYMGKRRFTMEGGEVASIAGGLNSYGDNYATYAVNDGIAVEIRIKEGLVRGSIYGAAAYASAAGDRRFVFTGGTIKGWVAGGANGTQSDGGYLYGSSALYIGGETQIDSRVNGTSSTNVINRAVGGNVFGAGCGYGASSNSGQVTEGTTVVVADEAYVERGVYGGGSYGYTTSTSTLYVSGGHVEGKNGGVSGTSYSASITGGVFGGACQNKGGTVNITMTDGLVEGGVYGGSNATGTISNNVTMQINGGQVGTSSVNANIHGGGYGNSTTVSGNVIMTIGSGTSATDWVKVYGNVYGGSALGTVGGNATITMNKGEINGNLFGGALGNNTYAALVNGNVAVTVNGGKVTGAVFGCNDANGTPKGTVTVTINGTDPSEGTGNSKVYALQGVYGGGNEAHYDPTTADNGYPQVIVNGCSTSIGEVYGGGNAAAVPQTDVTIYGGDIGSVFAGGNGISNVPANVGYQNKLEPTTANSYGNGTATAKIYGGTIGQVFGGSNAHGVIRDNVSVTIDKSLSTANPKCDMIVGEVYGGGNMAESKAATVSIGCTGDIVTGDNGHAAHPENIGTTLEGIGSVFGGANQAAVTSGNIEVNINKGIVANVFGGNNKDGNISGSIEVNIEKTSESNDCGWYVGNVFGGGNLAQYTSPNDGDGNPTYPHVNILNGTVSGNVYGGGKGLASDHTKGQVTGNPVVTIGDNVNGHTAVVAGDIYGGGDAGNVVGTPQVNVINKCNTSIAGDVYGGGNAADVSGTDVNIDGGNITGMVFGGGHGDKNANPQTEANVTNDVSVTVTGGTINKVFGGSNSKGTIDGDVTVYINKDANSCEMHINEVYGGGNEAAGNAGTITIKCTGDYENNGEGITTVYGGANAANVGNSINLTIKGGHIDNVYGGNNQSGSISGTTTVTVNWDDELTCGKYLGNVFGGGNLATLNGAATVNIQKGTVSHNVYGGGNQAGVGSATVSMTGGSVLEGLYGGCNTSGTVSGAISVSLTGGAIGTSSNRADVFGGGLGSATATSGNIGVTLNGTTIYGDLYGGSALGQVNGSTDHTTTLTISGNGLNGTIYGGGKGQNSPSAITAVSNGNVVINYNTANTNLTGLYGGANINGNVKGDITVNVNANVGASGTGNSIDVFGGGLGHATNTKGNVTVNVGAADGSSNPTVYGDIYGGSALGNVNDATADLTTVNILNGTVHGNVYGGGLGDATVLPNGYLDPTEPTVQAIVNGTVHVNIGDASNTNSTPTIDGKVFGCNNLAGTPKGPVYVDIYRTAHSGDNFYPNPEPSGANNIPTPTAANFAISEVYGGGNLAHYTTTVENASTHVHVHNCDNTIQYVYGGGNAANTVANEVTIDGGRMEYVFGGGNGAGTGNPGANVEGNAIVNIDGGIINYVFGGSNTLGVVNGVASMTFAAPPVCTRMVKELYGGGNEAPGGSVDLTIPCGVTGLNVVYGGSKNADIGSETLFNGGTKKNVVLTIEGGVLDKIFGGNNQGGTIWGDVTLNLKGGTIVDAFGGNNAGGNIKGTITVNVEDAESTTCPLVLTNVFGGGKDAAYTPADATISGPLVNIKHKKSGTSITGSVFGGGQGSTATVTANPVVTVGDLTSGHESYIATIDGDVYGGGDAADVVGTTTVLVQKCNTVINGDVYGGGNAADIVKNNGVGGTTSVTITGGTITGTDHGMVFGGGHGNKNANPQTEANVAGNVSVTINGGTINKVFGGSNSKGTIGGTVAVNVNKTGSCDMKVAEVYGGGNEAAGNAGSITIGCTGTLTTQASTPALIGTTLEGVGAVYGGANKADIGTSSNNSNITLTISSGIVGNVYGGNNTSGTIHGTIQVNVNKNAETCGWYVGNVFGGGNLAQYTGAPAVNILNGTVSQNVYGGGKGDANDHTKGQVIGNPVVTIGDNNVNGHTATVSGDVYGGGDAGNVVGTPQVNVINKCNTSIGNVYGGGNAADVNGTDVNIDGGVITGDVFGGGHGDKASLGSGHSDKVANVNGNVSVTITGGTIYRVFAGSNINGSISGTNNTLEINKSTTAACDMKIGEVYGGGNMANGNATSISVGCTGTLTTQASNPGQIGVTLEGIGAVYGGANNADIGTSSSNSNITLNINSGMVGNVYGGNNTSGTIYGTIQVNINKTSDACGWYVGNVFGGGNLAHYSGTPDVNIQAGTVSGSVFGGGNEAGVGGGDVAMTGGAVLTGIYGGCNTSGTVTGDILVNITGGTIGTDATHRANIHGGGYGVDTETQGDVTVNFGECAAADTPHSEYPKLYGDLYGGSALGEVNNEATDKTTVNVLNGELIANPTIVNGFTVYEGGNVFGGGLGRKADDTANPPVTAVEAKVYGTVTVNIGTGPTRTLNPDDDSNRGKAIIGGNIYGCNNTNGSPQDSVTVNIYRTHREATDEITYAGANPTYALNNVFGGGNEADYIPASGATNKKLKVWIHDCYNSIERVFGGSNAAAAGAIGNTVTVNTNIEGGRIYSVFGGGNGEVSAANINGNVNLEIHGGIVEEFFVGSNQQGTISGSSNVTVDDISACESVTITEFFCGGKYADVNGNINASIDCADDLTVTNLYGGCKEADVHGNVHLSVYGGHYTNVFGGSKGKVGSTPADAADIDGDVVLDLYGGTMTNVYGGSNVNGNIGGTITVNVVDAESDECPLYITNIYGGSNMTSYVPTDTTIISPVVNVVHAKYGITGNVYGGSKGVSGTEVVLKANPKVNIGYDDDMSTYLPNTYAVPSAPRAIVSGSVYGGSDAAKVTGNTAIFLRKRAKVFGNVYGGGNMGEVTGDTKVIVNGDNN